MMFRSGSAMASTLSSPGGSTKVKTFCPNDPWYHPPATLPVRRLGAGRGVRRGRSGELGVIYRIAGKSYPGRGRAAGNGGNLRSRSVNHTRSADHNGTMGPMRGRVLVVDDDAALAEMLELCFA